MTKIEWTDATWNPMVGCSIVSPGCTNCYAMKMAGRIEAMNRAHEQAGRESKIIPHYDGLTKPSKAGPVWTGKVALAGERALLEPLRRKTPTMYFVNSMSDLFHENVPDEWIDRIIAVMALARHHTFQVLTKRATRMRSYFESVTLARMASAMTLIPGHLGPRSIAFDLPLPNVWLGVSAERQQEADERVPDLLNTPAAVRFVSAEPLLGPIDFTRLELLPDKPATSAKGKRYMRAGVHLNSLRGRYCESGVEYVGDWDVNLPAPPHDATQRKLDWVIVGGESGPGARPMHPDWARSIRDQCAAAGTAFFFKQWGAWLWSNDDQNYAAAEEWRRLHFPKARAECHSSGHTALLVGKARAGRLLDGCTHDAMPTTTQREMATS